jgi:carbamoyl-phosphate synthase large subunit
VGCIGDSFHEALLKAMYSVGYRMPVKAVLISSGPAKSKADLLEAVRLLEKRGYKIFATRGTQQFLSNAGIAAKVAHWPDEAASPNTVELIKLRVVDLVINIPKDLSATELSNDYQIRRSAVDYNIPLITNARLASAFINAFCSVPESEMEIKAWDEY